MTCRSAIAFAVLPCTLFAATVVAQPGDRCLDVKARILDLLFPKDVSPTPYFEKFILRFGDSDTQLVVVVYPGEKTELIRCSLPGMSGGGLSRLISKMVAENPDVKDQEIAAHVKVNVDRSSINYEALKRSLCDLHAIRISPMLTERVACDEYSEYEYWHDTWQESVHYMVTGPFKGAPQDQLVQWMVRFRAKAPDLVKTPSAP